MPTKRAQAKYAIVSVDFYTKWAKTEPLYSLTKRKTTKFIWRSMIYRFCVPNAIVSDKKKHFDNQNFREFWSRLGITDRFSLLAHSQSNGQ